MKNVFKYFLFCVSTFITISCNNNRDQAPGGMTASDSSGLTAARGNPADTVLNGCYQFILNRDTFFLQLQVKGANITGNLLYDYFEKDRNEGTLQAGFEKGILKGWYLFRSEGILSVREVAWKPDNTALIPGTGEMIQRNDTVLFKNSDQLEFASKNRFVKVPCVL